MDIAKLAGELIETVKTQAEELSRLKGFKLKTIQTGIRMLPSIVKRVEKVGEVRNLTGAEKQALAVELVVALAPAPWWLPNKVYRAGLAMAVDAVVDAYKEKFDK